MAEVVYGESSPGPGGLSRSEAGAGETGAGVVVRSRLREDIFGSGWVGLG